MAFAIDGERLLGRLDAGAEPKIAERAVLDLEQRRAPALLEGGDRRRRRSPRLDLRLDVAAKSSWQRCPDLPPVPSVPRGRLRAQCGRQHREPVRPPRSWRAEGEEDIPRGGFSRPVRRVRPCARYPAASRRPPPGWRRRKNAVIVRLSAMNRGLLGELALPCPRMRSRSLRLRRLLARASAALPRYARRSPAPAESTGRRCQSASKRRPPPRPARRRRPDRAPSSRCGRRGPRALERGTSRRYVEGIPARRRAPAPSRPRRASTCAGVRPARGPDVVGAASVLCPAFPARDIAATPLDGLAQRFEVDVSRSSVDSATATWCRSRTRRRAGSRPRLSPLRAAPARRPRRHRRHKSCSASRKAARVSRAFSRRPSHASSCGSRRVAGKAGQRARHGGRDLAANAAKAVGGRGSPEGPDSPGERPFVGRERPAAAD